MGGGADLNAAFDQAGGGAGADGVTAGDLADRHANRRHVRAFRKGGLRLRGRRFGGLEVTPVYPRTGENAVRILVTAIKGSRARLNLRAPLLMHDDPASHKFSALVDDLNNGRASYPRRGR